MTTLGSLGDLHPFLAIALGLQARGHRVTIATSPYHGAKVESEGIGFHPVRPNITPDDKELMKLVMDAKKGGETVLRRIMFPNIRDTYADLVRSCARGRLAGHASHHLRRTDRGGEDRNSLGVDGACALVVLLGIRSAVGCSASRLSEAAAVGAVRQSNL